MKGDARFVHMINCKLPTVCDLLHRGIMCRQDLLFRLQRVINDADIRSTVTIKDYRAEIYKTIKK